MPKIQISCLGTMGRFGNQLFQYAFARKYAEIHGATLETPPWIGQTLFGLNDDPISEPLPRTESDRIPWGKTDIDLYGFFQFQDCVGKLSKQELRKWFTFKAEYWERYPKVQPRYAAAHLRRGDYVTSNWAYCVIPEGSYHKAAKKFGWDGDLIVVREDQPTIDEEMEAKGLGFLPDFFKLLQADNSFERTQLLAGGPESLVTVGFTPL